MLAFYINLEKRTDRRAFMEEQLAALGMHVERLRATTPDTIADDEIVPHAATGPGITLQPVEIATSTSHFRAWRRMLESGHRSVLVLEDDVRLSPLLPSFVAALEAQGRDTGLLRLETRLSQVLVHRRAEPAPLGFSLHRPLSYEAGAGAYVISAEHAARILSSPERFSMPIDDILFSLKSPFRRPSSLRVSVPGLALFQHEATPDYCVPPGVSASDAQASRDIRYANEAQAPRPRGLAKIRREIRRLGRQIRHIPEAVTARAFAVRTVIPFASDAITERPSAAPPRA